MKKYIGVKQISAKPMTMGEAYENGLLQKNRTITENEKTLDGYYVEYDNGHVSWSPKDVFEKAYNVADTPLDRMYIEYNELMSKHNKLVLFLGRKDAVEIAGENQVALMEQQKIQMHDYLLTLKERIELLNNN